MKKPEFNVVQNSPTPSSNSEAEVAKKIDELTIDGTLPEDDGPKPPRGGGGGVALPVPQPIEDQWVKSLAAFDVAVADLSRAARNVQIIRYPLESLARDIATMTREIGGMREELAHLRQNLTPPVAVETTTNGTVTVKHAGTLSTTTTIKPPTISRRVKSIAWHVTRAVIGALAVWGAMQALGWFWPEILNISWLK